MADFTKILFITTFLGLCDLSSNHNVPPNIQTSEPLPDDHTDLGLHESQFIVKNQKNHTDSQSLKFIFSLTFLLSLSLLFFLHALEKKIQKLF